MKQIILLFCLSFILASCNDELNDPAVFLDNRDACTEEVSLAYWQSLSTFTATSFPSATAVHLFDINKSSSGDLEFRMVIESSTLTTETIDADESGFIVEEGLDGWRIIPSPGSQPVGISYALAYNLLEGEDDGNIVENDLVGYKVIYEPSNLCETLNANNFIVEDDLDTW